jgi:hypothetical protein
MNVIVLGMIESIEKWRVSVRVTAANLECE